MAETGRYMEVARGEELGRLGSIPSWILRFKGITLVAVIVISRFSVEVQYSNIGDITSEVTLTEHTYCRNGALKAIRKLQRYVQDKQMAIRRMSAEIENP